MRTVFTGKYKLTCPECGVSVVTTHLAAMVWEHCPGCGCYVWDRYDTMMAEEVRLDDDYRSVAGPMVN